MFLFVSTLIRGLAHFYFINRKGIFAMITQEGTIRITATFSEDRTHRYTLKRIWSDDDSLPMATCLMSNAPDTQDITKGCLTSMLIQNQLSALGYRGCILVNLFSYGCQKLDLSGDISGLTDDTNTEQILQAVSETDVCVVAIGSLAKTYKKAAVFQNRLFALLRERGFEGKVHTIAAPCGTQGLHPLSGKLREVGTWNIVPFTLPLLPEPDPNANQNTAAASGKGKKKKTDKQDPKIIPIAQS